MHVTNSFLVLNRHGRELAADYHLNSMKLMLASMDEDTSLAEEMQRTTALCLRKASGNSDVKNIRSGYILRHLLMQYLKS